MKAWLVRKKDRLYATIVFAETRGKAKSLAMWTDCCFNAEFFDIEVYRQPQMDKYYIDGKKEMDWCDPKDRIALVKDCGFSCEYDQENECDDCLAKSYCDIYTNRVHCVDCKHLMFSDCYGECEMGYKPGIVMPDDSCGRGEAK